MTNVFKKGNLGTETDMHRREDHVKKHREMANKHRKICSKLFIIREMQVKIRERSLTSPVSIAIIIKKNNKLQTVNGGEDVEKMEPYCCWWEYKLVQSLWRIVWRFLL